MEGIFKTSIIGVEYFEQKGFFINRPRGTRDYVFLHFLTPVLFEIDGTKINTPENTVIIFSPKHPQRFTTPYTDLVHNWLHFTGDVMSLFEELGMECNRLYRVNNSSFITAAMQEIKLEKKMPGVYCDISVHGLLVHLFSKIAQSINQTVLGDANPTRAAAFELLTEIRKNILNGAIDSHELEVLAHNANYSPSRFWALYKSFFGTTPKKDFIEVRLVRAKHMLVKTNKSITQISKDLGYNSVYHFVRQFRKKTGYTPGKYRN